MQFPPMHCAPAVQGLPIGRGPTVQTPMPSQKRESTSDTQVGGSSRPFGTGAQVPRLATRLHCWQVPLQAVLQQTPSAQLPLAQSLNVVQLRPSSDLHCWLASQAWSVGQVSSGEPAGTFVQVPELPATLHDLHRPAHSVVVCAQQTPSTQLPDIQFAAVAAVQPVPFGRFAAFGKYSQNSDGP